jgi:hypothetical protein
MHCTNNETIMALSVICLFERRFWELQFTVSLNAAYQISTWYGTDIYFVINGAVKNWFN